MQCNTPAGGATPPTASTFPCVCLPRKRPHCNGTILSPKWTFFAQNWSFFPLKCSFPECLRSASTAYVVYPEKWRVQADWECRRINATQQQRQRCSHRTTCRASPPLHCVHCNSAFVLKYCSEKSPLQYLGQKSCNLHACSPKHLTTTLEVGSPRSINSWNTLKDHTSEIKTCPKQDVGDQVSWIPIYCAAMISWTKWDLKRQLPRYCGL